VERGTGVWKFSRRYYPNPNQRSTGMKVRMEKKPGVKVVGNKKAFRNDSTESLIPAIRSEISKTAYNELLALSCGQPSDYIGMCDVCRF
jgi:hypothetical protein